MKKLFHLSIIALLAITVTSCSKSSNDLAANGKTTAVKGLGMQIGNSDYGTILDNETEIYNFINQPSELELGVPERSFISASAGYEFAVFYVIVSPDYINEPMKTATLTTADNSTGEIIATYDLINSSEANNYGVIVPDELNRVSSMFAVVRLVDLAEHLNAPINLYSEIVTEKGTLISRMGGAFVYTE